MSSLFGLSINDSLLLYARYHSQSERHPVNADLLASGIITGMDIPDVADAVQIGASPCWSVRVLHSLHKVALKV
ncbi:MULTISPECIES: hypothetical protein [unclassified Peribacillus]|uniref:hypothetical protein n=1 Tax=unclassified Peribacillus TaxID=2675266 RepID=UPI001E5CF2AB|nr:hypothetical protein [Peribacillus sp. Bi96]